MTDDTFEGANRKLVAILALDVVGFARMVGRDEDGALASLGRARDQVIDPAVARHRGRVFKVMGDGSLAEFPSSTLALQAAVAIQAQMPDHNARAAPAPSIVLRIGIHQGDVLVHGDDLLGNGVNIAARLEPLSPHGGICVSARVREDAYGKLAIAFEDGGDRELKNIERPMRVFFVPPAGERAAPSRALTEGEATLLAQARSHSLVVINSALPGLAPGQVVALTGKPLTVGRQPPSALVLPDSEVSRAHCRVELVGGAPLVTDLGSTNGTFVDDRRVGEPVWLSPGATLRIGSVRLRYVSDTPAATLDETLVVRR